MNDDVEGESGSEDVPAEQPVFARLLNGDLDALARQGILLAHVDEPFRGSNRIGAQDQPFQDAVRVSLEQAAVHEGARIPLISVDNDIFRFAGSVARGFPLPAGGKSAAAAAAQVGLFHFVEHRFGRHFGKSLRQRAVSADGDVVQDAGGVDPDVVPEQDALLVPVEGDVLQALDALAGSFIEVQEVADRTFTRAEPVDDGRRVLRLHFGIAGVGGVDHHQRGAFAETVAPGPADADFVPETALFDLAIQCVRHRLGAAGKTTRSRTHLQPVLGVALGDGLRSQFFKIRDGLQAFHACASSLCIVLMILSSRLRSGSR